jgi:hypothetical protein
MAAGLPTEGTDAAHPRAGDAALAIECGSCGKLVEVCEFCEEPACKHVICDECLRVRVGERRPRTFTAAE